MNWQYLKYFAAVAQEEHFTRAAEKLYITQSALSKAMNNLQNDLGVSLFIKQGRNVRLTPMGIVFRDRVLQATYIIDGAVKEINMLSASRSGAVHVASIFTLGTNFLPQMFSEYNSNFEPIDFFCIQESTAGIIDDVLKQKADVGFCGCFNYNEKNMGLERVLVMKEQLYLIVPHDHRLSSCKSVRFRDILDEPFIQWNSTTGIVLSIENTLKQHHIPLDKIKYNYSATEDNTVAEMVRHHFGLALMANVKSINMAGLKRIRISDIPFCREIFMVWKKGDPDSRQVSQNVKRFINFIISEHSLSE